MTALDTYMLLCKLIVGFELFEYAVLLHIKFDKPSNNGSWRRNRSSRDSPADAYCLWVTQLSDK
jgi:hypothetical protein